MSFKDRIINVIKTHPNLVMFGIWLTIAFGIGAAIVLLDHGQTMRVTQNGEYDQKLLSYHN